MSRYDRTPELAWPLFKFKSPFGMSLLWHKSDIYIRNSAMLLKFLYKSVFSTKLRVNTFHSFCLLSPEIPYYAVI